MEKAHKAKKNFKGRGSLPENMARALGGRSGISQLEQPRNVMQ